MEYDAPGQAIPAWADRLIAHEHLPGTYVHEVRTVVAPVARWIESRRNAAARPLIIGLSGAQGSGKSTFALFLRRWLIEESALATACLSLDDLYLGEAARTELAAAQHPLLQTRGVPGTHDVDLGMRLLGELTEPGSHGSTVRLPVFDKGIDDRAAEDAWPAIDAPVDIVLFEGWCIGARAQDPAALATPVNDLEASEDPDGAWRRYVNERLGDDYAALWRRLDALILLRVPSFEVVFEWRALQEQKLRSRERNAAAGQDADALERFIRHYERLTRHMLATMADFADLTIDIDESHRMSIVQQQLSD